MSTSNWKAYRHLLTDGECAAYLKLEEAGFMVDYFPDRRDKFGVYAGSHGGSGSTLRKAIKRCMACCGIWKYWENNFGKGERSIDFVKRICDEHLGGWKPNATPR